MFYLIKKLYFISKIADRLVLFDQIYQTLRFLPPSEHNRVNKALFVVIRALKKMTF